MDLRAVEVCTRVLAHLRGHPQVTDALFAGKARDGLYEPVLAESEREAVADLLQYLENVRTTSPHVAYTLFNILIAGRD